MSDVKTFKLPDVGEGLTEAEIISWKVKVGDTVKVNDVVQIPYVVDGKVNKATSITPYG